MQQSFDLYFVSSNKNKYHETKKILNSFDISVGFRKYELEEIQSDSLVKIAKKKVNQAFEKYNKPVIVEDAGLFIKSLNGFPGPYSSYIFKTIGNAGILNLLNKNREASFFSIVSFHDELYSKTFSAKVDGKISTIQKGNEWGYDPIFIPNNYNKTFAELQNKDELSHRFKALRKFANWY